METNRKNPSNYERLCEELLSPEVVAVLLSQSVYINCCLVCSERFVPYENMCDHECDKHILKWLKSESGDKNPYDNIVKILKTYAKEKL